MGKPPAWRRVIQAAVWVWLAVGAASAPAPATASPPAPLSQAVEPAAAGMHPGLARSNQLVPAEPDPDASWRLRLPDLRTLPLRDLRIQLLRGNRRYLRLENTIWNSGQGPLELTGENNTQTSRTRVHQHIYSAGEVQRDVLVGEFVWHPTHDHWHFDQFTLYQLWTVTPDYHLGRVVASSGKLSYCVTDTGIVDRDHPHLAKRQAYDGCGRRTQGLSAGWGDTYKSTVDGQALDLTGLANGLYALSSTVNPNAMIVEQDYGNNSTLVYLVILADSVRPVTLRQARSELCDEPRCR